ncbi:hypothetical protein BJ165DRAFT_145716 [Panaeolus papilionaceus]|nr:hypothetical protein BJ165DRAFT_145716 [Panaeolus papilionaceus]
MTQLMEEFGPSHPVYRRVPWPHELLECSICLPRSLIPLLSNNDPISLEKSSLVHEFKKVTIAQMESNNMKIRRLEEQIAQIKQGNNSLQKQLFACDVMFSPFRRLSTDVLYHISSHLPQINSSDPYTSTSHSASALSQVSKSWRLTSNSVSSLWTIIQVDCSYRNSTPIEPLVNHVEHYSSLSGTQPLTVQLDDNTNKETYKRDTDRLLRILDWIFTQWQSRSRLSRLHIRASASVQNLEVIRRLKMFANMGFTLPNVGSYLALPWDEISSAEDYKMDEDDFVTLSLALPKLRNVWVGCRNFMMDTPFNFRPLPNGTYSLSYLRTLYLGHWIGYEDFIEFLKAGTQLESAWFEMGAATLEDHIVHSVPSQPVVHHNIKELVVQIEGFGYNILWLFTNLKFPCLKTLQLHLVDADLLDEDNEEDQPDPPDQDDFMDTFPNLETLYLHDLQKVGAESFWELFNLFPIVGSITHLVFHGITREVELRGIIDWVLDLDGTRLRFPRLQLLEVIYPLTTSAFSGKGRTLEKVITESLSRTDDHLSSIQVRMKILALPDNVASQTEFVQDLAVWSERVRNNPGLLGNTVLQSTIDVDIANPGDIIRWNSDEGFKEEFMSRFF